MQKVGQFLLVPLIAQIFACFLAIASVSHARERPPSGKINTDFSRVYIFVDKSKSSVVGHQHAVEGK